MIKDKFILSHWLGLLSKARFIKVASLEPAEKQGYPGPTTKSGLKGTLLMERRGLPKGQSPNLYKKPL